MQIHELNTLNRLPSSTDFLAIDTGLDTAKIPANELFASDEIVAQAITEWLDAHPEATTTVQDGAITSAKINNELADLLYYKTYFMEKYTPTVGETISDFVSNKIAEGYRKFVFPKGFVLNETLTIKNIKGESNNGVILCGHLTNGAARVDPDIILNTGGIGIRFLDTQNCVIENLNLTNIGANNPSTVGVLWGRDAASGNSSSSNSCRNVTVRLETTNDATINNGYGTIAFYSNTSELLEFCHVNGVADVGIVISRYDICHLNPETSYNSSNKDIYIIGKNSFVSEGFDATNKRAVLLDGIEGFFASFYARVAGGSTNELAVEVTRGVQVCDINIDTESCKEGFHISGGIRCGNIKGFFTNVVTQFNLVSGGVLTECDIASFSSHFTDADNVAPFTFLKNVSSTYVQNNTFRLRNENGDEEFKIGGGVFSGNMIRADYKVSINRSAGTVLNNRVWSTTGLYDPNVRVAHSYNEPTAASYGSFDRGDVFFNTNVSNSDKGTPVMFFYNGSAFMPVGQAGVRSVNPATATPHMILEVVKDSSGNLWMATGTTAGAFVRINN